MSDSEKAQAEESSGGGMMGWLQRTFSTGSNGSCKGKDTKVKAMAAAFESPKAQPLRKEAPSNHEVGELAQKFQSQINTSFEEAEKSHKSSTPSKAVSKITKEEADRNIKEERAAIYVDVSEEPTSGEAFKRNIDKFRTAEEVASGLGLGWYAEDENSLGSGGDNSASPTIAQLPTPRKQRTSAGGGGAVSAGRQAVLDRERRLKEEEAMRSFKKETEFRKVGSSGAEGRYKKTTKLVTPRGVAPKKSFDDLP